MLLHLIFNYHCLFGASVDPARRILLEEAPACECDLQAFTAAAGAPAGGRRSSDPSAGSLVANATVSSPFLTPATGECERDFVRLNSGCNVSGVMS